MDTDKKKLEDFRLRVYEKLLLEFDRQGDSTDMVIFANEKLSELFDWESVLQIKKEEFEDRLSIAPKSNHQSIYNTEFSESSNQYDPEINFSLRSIAYYLIEQGLNWDIGQIIRRWPILISWSSEQRIFEDFKFPFGDKSISCFVADGEFLENSIVDGISQVHYKEYLKDRRKDFYPEEFDSEKIEKGEVGNEKNITWDGTKLELCELIKALIESKRIKLNGKLIQQKDLILLFGNFFNEDLRSFYDSLRDAKTTNKWNDGNTFMNELSKHITDFKDKLK